MDGLVKLADGGTLFLDEVGELPIVVRLISEEKELESFIDQADLFDDIRLILILTAPKLVARGHLLRPRFVDVVSNNNFSKTEAVFHKMLNSLGEL
ncbi:MAG: hypothetical protein C0613_05425 [Desulfobulbaceae bacterium]|nr:MAG: hypothetical protein C0613_05425 [Desulfobulbaceae bacterium]